MAGFLSKDILISGFGSTSDLFPDFRCHLSTEQLDCSHHLFMFYGIIAHIDQKPLVLEDLMLEKYLLNDLVRGSHKIRTTQIPLGLQLSP